MKSFVHETVAARIVFGEGTTDALPGEAAGLGIGRAVLLCSPGRRAVAERLAGRFEQGAAVICDAAEPGMPQHAFNRVITEIDDSGADGLVALGGGSPIGLGKAVAAATRIAFLAVPTTYSGSERANNWYIGAGPDRKKGATDDALPRTVIYDPALTIGLPAGISAASGMNAMAHAVESLYGPDTNPVIQALSEEAVRMLGGALPAIVADPGDREARENALYGAWLAAEFRATSGLEHALAQQVRSRFRLGHAECHAIMVPYAIAWNYDAAPDAMGRIERALGVDHAAIGLWELNRRCGIPTGLNVLGLTGKDIEAAADAVARVEFPNPRPVARSDIRTIIAAALEGAPPRF